MLIKVPKRLLSNKEYIPKPKNAKIIEAKPEIIIGIDVT